MGLSGSCCEPPKTGGEHIIEQTVRRVVPAPGAGHPLRGNSVAYLASDFLIAMKLDDSSDDKVWVNSFPMHNVIDPLD